MYSLNPSQDSAAGSKVCAFGKSPSSSADEHSPGFLRGPHNLLVYSVCPNWPGLASTRAESLNPVHGTP